MVYKLRHREFIGYHVYTAHRALAKALDATLAPFGITSSQWNALQQLEEHGAMTQRELSELLNKEQATVARLIDRLVKRGLVERAPHPTDRRANIVENTEQASELLVEAQSAVVASADAIASGVSDADLAKFFEILDRISDNALAAIEKD